MIVKCALAVSCMDEGHFDFRESRLARGCLLQGACAFCCLSRGPGRTFLLIALVHDVVGPNVASECNMAFKFEMEAGFATAAAVECT